MPINSTWWQWSNRNDENVRDFDEIYVGEYHTTLHYVHHSYPGSTYIIAYIIKAGKS